MKAYSCDTAAAAFLDACRWKVRPLIVVAPRPDVRLVRDQRAAIDDVRDELRHRDIVRIDVLGKDVTIDLEPRPDISATGLRQHLGLARDDISVLLLGKDGGVKLRRSAAIPPGELFETIDAMPMRRREMKDHTEGHLRGRNEP